MEGTSKHSVVARDESVFFKGLLALLEDMTPHARPICLFSHHPLWLLLFGVCAGGVIGAADIGVASLFWHLHGEPDGFFRGGWAGVIISAILYGLSGAVAGLTFGGLLILLEGAFRRVVPLARLALVMILIALCCFMIAYFLMFHSNGPDLFLALEGIVLVACGASAVGLSRLAKQPLTKLRA